MTSRQRQPLSGERGLARAASANGGPPPGGTHTHYRVPDTGSTRTHRPTTVVLKRAGTGWLTIRIYITPAAPEHDLFVNLFNAVKSDFPPQNYSYMELGIQRLLAVLLIAGCDVTLAIYQRYSLVLPSVEPAVSYAAHLAGGVAGLSLGLVILRNFSPKQRPAPIRWLALGVIITSALFALLFNVIPADRQRQYV